MNRNPYNRPALNILEEFAKATGRKFEFTENQYPDHPLEKTFKYRRTFFIPDNGDETSFFAGFSDAKKYGEHAIYCGVFIPINIPVTSRLKIRKKDILDKLNPFLKSNSFTTGNRKFDDRLIVEGDNNIEIQRFLKLNKVQSTILRAFEIKELVFVGVNELNVNFVPALNGKSCISIFITRKWVLDDLVINKMFRLIEELKNIEF